MLITDGRFEAAQPERPDDGRGGTGGGIAAIDVADEQLCTSGGAAERPLVADQQRADRRAMAGWLRGAGKSALFDAGAGE